MGVALLGAIVLVATGAVTEQEARAAIHMPTLTLVFYFLTVVPTQPRMGGFYDWAARWLGALPLRLPARLGAFVAVTTGLAAVVGNDTVCLWPWPWC
jgi:Na+/H+ antiporter NhaD/arsenite permease-like protein